MTTTLAEKSATTPSAPGSGAIRLSAKALKLEEHVRRSFDAKVPAGCTQEDPLHPEFWAKEAHRLRRHDMIRLLADDESWQMEVIVETVRQTGADVSVYKVMKRTALSRAETWLGEDHHTQYRSGEGWCVIRAKDGHPVIRGHALEVSAINQFHREQPRPVGVSAERPFWTPAEFDELVVRAVVACDGNLIAQEHTPRGSVFRLRGKEPAR